MYGKSYESMYKGSMVGAGLNVFAVWNYIITNTHFGVIELNTRLMKAILGGTEKEIQDAIDYLSRPDPESRNKDEDGRRLVKEGQFQYRVVSWSEYQSMKSADDLREYNRKKQAEYRANKKAEKALKDSTRTKSAPLAGEVAALRASAAGDEAGADQIAAERRGMPDPGGLSEAVRATMLRTALENGDEVTIRMLENAGVRLEDFRENGQRAD